MEILQHVSFINSNTAAAQISFGVEISRCEMAIFHQRGERVLKFCLERLGTHFGTSLERVMDAFGTQMERERSVRLFLSSTVGGNIT